MCEMWWDGGKGWGEVGGEATVVSEPLRFHATAKLNDVLLPYTDKIPNGTF